MRVKVLYFANFRDHAGGKEEFVELPDVATVSDLVKMIEQLHPSLSEGLPTAVMAVNREFAFSDEPISDGDEIAIFPPVSGGGHPPTILQVTQDELDFNEILPQLVGDEIGAICMFTGTVRGVTTRGETQSTAHLEYEAYHEMAESKLVQVAEEIRDQWSEVKGIAIIQRLGHLEVGDPTVMIACSAGHRDSGVFEAARYGIDRLKQIVPIWKKEVGPSGEFWVEGDYLPDKSDREV
jgi:molybdopterin synthase catalytic subunit